MSTATKIRTNEDSRKNRRSRPQGDPHGIAVLARQVGMELDAIARGKACPRCQATWVGAGMVHDLGSPGCSLSHDIDRLHDEGYTYGTY